MIAILGGGIAGASLAWALARAGRRDVVVFDPRQPAEGSTGRAMGGFRTQHGSQLNIELALASRPVFEAWGQRVDFQPNGYLYLAENAGVAAELRRRAELQVAAGLPIEHPRATDILAFLSADDVVATNFCRLDGLYLPSLVLEAFTEEARAAGAQFRYGQEATARNLEAEVVVIACGIWSREAGRRLGVELGVEALERGVFQVGPFDWLSGPLPMTLEAGSGYHFRERDRRLLVMFPGDQHAWAPVRDWLAHRLPAAAVDQPESYWTGSYEVTFDHHPLVGQTSRPGVWASCGFSGHGVMQSPAVARSLAAMILGDTPPLDVSALSPLRTEPLVDTTQL